METLCTLIFQFGPQYLGFQSMVDKVLARNKIQHFKYESIVAFLKQSNEASFYSDHFSFHSSINETTSGPSLTRSTDGTNPQNAGGGGTGGEELPLEMTTVKKLKANETNLRKAWEASQRSTKEDWAEWIRRFSVELLRESPSPALRSCLSLAQVYHALARELFNSSFVSCWTELHEQYQDQLVHSLETALCSPSIPPEILQTLLNLAEFMEHDDKVLVFNFGS
jgi:FKBP12-rapamycin complex-associated protein